MFLKNYEIQDFIKNYEVYFKYIKFLNSFLSNQDYISRVNSSENKVKNTYKNNNMLQLTTQ